MRNQVLVDLLTSNWNGLMSVFQTEQNQCVVDVGVDVAVDDGEIYDTYDTGL